VTLKQKIVPFVMCASLSLFAVGCGGITASHTISPASFFLPGLLKADPPQVKPFFSDQTPVPEVEQPLLQPFQVKQVALVC